MTSYTLRRGEKIHELEVDFTIDDQGFDYYYFINRGIYLHGREVTNLLTVRELDELKWRVTR